MSLYLNNNHIRQVIYNNSVDLTQFNYNGIDLWYKVNITASTPLSTNTIVNVESHGTRSPADKISNYVIVNNPNMIAGKKYGYILGTSGETYGNRTLVDGRVVTVRAYNNGYVAPIYGLTINNFVNGGVVNTYSEVSAYGSFTYNPTTIVAGDGSSTYGQYIASYTYNAPDPGKGDAVAFIYPYEYLHDLCIIYNKPFT